MLEGLPELLRDDVFAKYQQSNATTELTDPPEWTLPIFSAVISLADIRRA